MNVVYAGSKRNGAFLNQKGSTAYSFLGFAIIVIVVVGAILFFPWEDAFQGPKDNDFKAAQNALKAGNWEKAAELYEKVIKKQADNAEAYVGLSMADQMLGKPDKALENAKKAVNLAAKNAQAWGQKGILEKTLGNADQALEDLKKAAELNPKYAWAHAQIADLLRRQQEFESALESVNKSLDIKPNFVEAVRLKAYILTRMGNCKDASEAYAKAHEMDPDNAATVQDKAWFLLTCPDETVKDASKGLELAKKAADLQAENAMVQETLAEAFYQAGQPKMAVEHQKKAISLRMKECPGGECVDEMKKRLRKYELAAGQEFREDYDILPKKAAM